MKWHILYYSIVTTFLKWQNYRAREQLSRLSSFQGSGVFVCKWYDYKGIAKRDLCGNESSISWFLCNAYTNLHIW